MNDVGTGPSNCLFLEHELVPDWDVDARPPAVSTCRFLAVEKVLDCRRPPFPAS
jgi:hypothetical protein